MIWDTPEWSILPNHCHELLFMYKLYIRSSSKKLESGEGSIPKHSHNFLGLLKFGVEWEGQRLYVYPHNEVRSVWSDRGLFAHHFSSIMMFDGTEERVRV